MTQKHPPHPNLQGRHVVVRSIDRAPLDVVDQLGPIGTATVHEAIGRRGYAGTDLHPIQQDVRVGGSAVTVLSHPGDNMMIHAAVEVCTPGDVLVVVTTAPSIHGMFGDLLATSAKARGVRGLVSDTGVRDARGHTLLFDGEALLGAVDDPAFTRAFFDIWLGERTSRPALRERLLAGHAE